MSILLFLIFGFIVGLLARAIMPGEQKMSMVMTTLLGIVGSFIGGFIGSLIHGGGNMFAFHTSGIIGSVLGALVLLALLGYVQRHRLAH